MVVAASDGRGPVVAAIRGGLSQCLWQPAFTTGGSGRSQWLWQPAVSPARGGWPPKKAAASNGVIRTGR